MANARWSDWILGTSTITLRTSILGLGRAISVFVIKRRGGIAHVLIGKVGQTSVVDLYLQLV